jgi:hypothetical protein
MLERIKDVASALPGCPIGENLTINDRTVTVLTAYRSSTNKGTAGRAMFCKGTHRVIERPSLREANNNQKPRHNNTCTETTSVK